MINKIKSSLTDIPEIIKIKDDFTTGKLGKTQPKFKINYNYINNNETNIT